MISYLQLPYHFDALQLQKEVSMLDKAIWQMHYQTKQYEGEWSGIPLRSIDGKIDNIIISPTGNARYCDTEFLLQSPYLKEVLANFICELQAVRLLKLNAGAIIKQHRDADLCFEKGEVRIHIPILTNHDVEFYLADDKLELKEGDCWYMNFNLPHRLHNKSNINRIHLVIDALVNNWVKDLFSSASIINKKEIVEEGFSEEQKRQMIFHFREMNTATTNKMADDLEKEMQHAT